VLGVSNPIRVVSFKIKFQGTKEGHLHARAQESYSNRVLHLVWFGMAGGVHPTRIEPIDMRDRVLRLGMATMVR
jgi:hypothetical protein